MWTVFGRAGSRGLGEFTVSGCLHVYGLRSFFAFSFPQCVCEMCLTLSKQLGLGGGLILLWFLSKVCVCVSEENPPFITVLIHTCSMLLSVLIHVFDLRRSYKSYCLDSDKMWAITTVVCYYVVEHCGLSGRLWHRKHVRYVGVWSSSPAFSFPIDSP